jgi:hypothetical protein
MTENWESAEDGFIEADVIRWVEALWPPKRGKKQSRPIGQQEVIGQITSIDGDYVSVKVMQAKNTENRIGKVLAVHKPDSIIQKKKDSLMKGSPERLLWSDETARTALLTSPKNQN